MQRHDPRIVISDLARTEFASVMAIRVRSRQARLEAAQEAFAKLDTWIASAATPAWIERTDLAQAEAFIRRMDLTLRTQDAMHIALALRLGLPVATFDARMAAAARALGVPVLDA